MFNIVPLSLKKWKVHSMKNYDAKNKRFLGLYLIFYITQMDQVFVY